MGKGTELDSPDTNTKPPDFEDLGHPQIREAFRGLDAKCERLLDILHDMIFVATPNGRLREVNQAGVAIFGFDSKEEMLRQASLSTFFVDSSDYEQFQQRLQEGGSVTDTVVEMKRKDGVGFLACISANLRHDEDGTLSCEGFLRDVSEGRRWRNALVESLKVNRALQETDGYNRELVKQIVQMLMIMSHDIRGPLVAIAATLKLLIRGTYGNMDVSVANTLNDLMARIRSLLGVAEDYLSKMQSVEESFKIECQTLDLRQDVIDPILDEISSDIEQNEITIDNRLGAIPAGTIRINVDRIWLKAVFRNLFKNAIKYGGKGCRIAFGFEDHGAFYRLNVYNSGKSIPQEERAKLFTRYGRIGIEQEDAPDGVGLGLFLIKEIITKHGGDIWYEAKSDGSDFVFTLTKESL